MTEAELERIVAEYDAARIAKENKDRFNANALERMSPADRIRTLADFAKTEARFWQAYAAYRGAIDEMSGFNAPAARGL